MLNAKTSASSNNVSINSTYKNATNFNNQISPWEAHQSIQWTPLCNYNKSAANFSNGNNYSFQTPSHQQTTPPRNTVILKQNNKRPVTGKLASYSTTLNNKAPISKRRNQSLTKSSFLEGDQSLLVRRTNHRPFSGHIFQRPQTSHSSTKKEATRLLSPKLVNIVAPDQLDDSVERTKTSVEQVMFLDGIRDRLMLQMRNGTSNLHQTGNNKTWRNNFIMMLNYQTQNTKKNHTQSSASNSKAIDSTLTQIQLTPLSKSGYTKKRRLLRLDPGIYFF